MFLQCCFSFIFFITIRIVLRGLQDLDNRKLHEFQGFIIVIYAELDPTYFCAMQNFITAFQFT